MSHGLFYDILTTNLLGLERGRSVAVWRVINISDFIINILICVLKMKAGLTGLERHEGE